MALWTDDKKGTQFDDGLTAKPGEEGFTRDVAAEHYGHKNFSYSGTPNWQPPQPAIDPDQQEPSGAQPHDQVP